MKSPEDISDFYSVAFIVFDNTTAISLTANTYSYNFAPDGYSATGIVVSVKDSVLYSSFVPFTVSPNEEIPFTLQATTTEEFKEALDALH